MHHAFVYEYRWNGVVLYSPMVGIDRSKTFNPLITFIVEHYLAYYFPKAIVFSKTRDRDVIHYSRDKKMENFMFDNPLWFPFEPRCRTGIELLSTAKFVQNNLEVFGDTDIPLLIFHGSGDDVTLSSMSLKMVESVSQRQINKDATHKLKDNGTHCLNMDLCREEVLNETIEWLDNHNNK